MYGEEDFVVVQSLLQSLQKLVQAAKASSVLPADDDTVRFPLAVPIQYTAYS